MTSVQWRIYLVSMPCLEVREIFPGEFDIGDLLAFSEASQSHVIRYQKYFMRARYSPAALSFFQNLGLFVLLCS